MAAITPVADGDRTMLNTVCVVTIDTRDVTVPIPLVGFPLYVGPPKLHDDANTYRGSPTVVLSSADDPDAQLLGIVWPVQPPQRLAHRSLAMIAVCNRGEVSLADWSFADDSLAEAYSSLVDNPPGSRVVLSTAKNGSMALTTLASDHRVVVTPLPN